MTSTHHDLLAEWQDAWSAVAHVDVDGSPIAAIDATTAIAATPTTAKTTAKTTTADEEEEWFAVLQSSLEAYGRSREQLIRLSFPLSRSYYYWQSLLARGWSAVLYHGLSSKWRVMGGRGGGVARGSWGGSGRIVH